MLNESLHNGGPDGLYTANELHEGGTGFAELPPRHLTIGQGNHESSIYHYNDTLNFIARDTSDTHCTVTAFSISNIGGALGDQGQNYANLEALVQATGLQFDESVLLGCGVADFAQSSQHMELLIAAQLLFMMVPIARMQPCVGESVVKRVVLGAPLVAFVCMVIQSCLPGSNTHAVLPFVALTLVLYTLEAVFHCIKYMLGTDLPTIVGRSDDTTGEKRSLYTGLAS